MQGLKELLNDHSSLLRRVQAKAPPPAEIRRVAASLRGTGGVTLELEETGKLQERIESTIRSVGTASLTKRDLRMICGVFLHPPAPPGRKAEIGDAIISEVRRKRQRSAILALFNSYLDSFRFDDADIVRLGHQLDGLTRDITNGDAHSWDARAKAFALFDAAEAPRRLAKDILSTREPPMSVFALAGLDTEVRVRGDLAEAAFQIACRDTVGRRGGGAMECQRQILRWAHDNNGKLVFPRSFASLAAALLEPWEEGEPDHAYRSELIQTLERGGGGDPRTKPAGWRDTQQRAPIAYAILLRWLTRASVMQFLDIVGRSITDANGRRMWSYRRAFWTSYLLGDGSGPTIQKAWIAFGSDAVSLARATARETGDNSFLAFGRQSDKSSQHSALIVEISDFLIVDWSHNAQYNVWKLGDQKKPKLFEQNYPSGTLYNAPLKDSHINPAGFTWQKRLAKIIEGRHFYSEKPSWRPSRV